MSPHCTPSQLKQAAVFFGTLAIALGVPAAAAATLFTATTVMVAATEPVEMCPTCDALQTVCRSCVYFTPEETADAAAFDACADQFDTDPARCGDE